MIFDMLGVFIYAIDRANFYALGQAMMANTLGTQFRINNINILAL